MVPDVTIVNIIIYCKTCSLNRFNFSLELNGKSKACEIHLLK